MRHKLLLYLVVIASGELTKIQECCFYVDYLQGHIVFMLRVMRYMGKAIITSSDFDLAQHFSCSASVTVKTVECGQIFILACRQLRKKAQHNFIGQF